MRAHGLVSILGVADEAAFGLRGVTRRRLQSSPSSETVEALLRQIAHGHRTALPLMLGVIAAEQWGSGSPCGAIGALTTLAYGLTESLVLLLLARAACIYTRRDSDSIFGRSASHILGCGALSPSSSTQTAPHFFRAARLSFHRVRGSAEA